MVNNLSDTEATAQAPETQGADEQQALAIVNRDFSRAKKYLHTWHNEIVERYKHYFGQAHGKNIEKDKSFPVPFTSEQVDQLVAEFMDKLWFKGEPCSIFARVEADGEAEDADAKREFMQYQDVKDNIFEKLGMATQNIAITGIAPAVVNYRDDKTIKVVPTEQPIMLKEGLPATDLDGMPLTQLVDMPQQITVYQGASVDLIDPVTFYFTPEKREVYDEHPYMIRTFKTLDWLTSTSYINLEPLDLAELKEERGQMRGHGDPEFDKRSVMDLGADNEMKTEEFEYVEWYGRADFTGTGEKKNMIVGVVEGKYVVRMDDADEIFNLGHHNIVIGNLKREQGEIRGQSLLDKIHATQHALDSLMGMWMKSLRQTANPMWIAWADMLKRKRLVNDAGEVILTKGDVNSAVKRVEQEQISQDIYAGMEMVRLQGQNASGLSDIAEGISQRGVETLGEASILESKAAVKMKLYLRTFEKTFVEPLWDMRNQINMRFVTDIGYMYQVMGPKVVFWKKITPDQIRANVDFICEASTRENQRGVITQQVLQALNIVSRMIPILGPIPAVKLLEKMYREAFGWKEDEVAEMLPMDMILQNMMMMQMAQVAQTEGGGGAPGEQSQPRTEGEAISNANQSFNPTLRQMQ